MSVGIVQFSADLDAVAAKFDIAIATLLKKVTLEAFNSITELTPVDTGRARAGWALSINSPSDFIPQDLTPEERSAWRKKKKKGGKVPQSIFEKPEPNFEVLALIDGSQPIFIINNLEYIEALEDGHSAKAPAGMVRITVAALEIGIGRLLAANP